VFIGAEFPVEHVLQYLAVCQCAKLLPGIKHILFPKNLLFRSHRVVLLCLKLWLMNLQLPGSEVCFFILV